MPKKSSIKDLYSEIRRCLFYMIPEKWDSIYLYASVIQWDNGNETGEMFFYYYPKSILKKNPVNVYQIPQKFNLNEEEYIKLTQELYNLIKQLRHECKKFDKIDWSNITISIENAEFLAEYNFDDLTLSNYSSEDRMAIWQYKYLKYPIEKFKKEQKIAIQDYLEEEEIGLHRMLTYTETFYQQHEHNSIEYDIAKNTDNYIKVDEVEAETTDFEIVNDNTYQIQSNKMFRKKRPKKTKEKNTKVKQNNFIEEEKEIVVRNQILKY